MRILFHAGVDLSLPGGLETHLRELARGLETRGHEVEIFGKPPDLPPFRMVYRVEPDRYDVLHHHAGTWPRGIAAGDRYVRTLHFCTAAKMARYVGIGRLRTLANPGNWSGILEEWRSVRRAGRLIAVAPRVVRDYARFYGLDPSRPAVIPNGAAFERPGESRDSLRRRHGIAEGAPVLLTIGRADFVKGFDLLERAWSAARAQHPGAIWVSVGGDSARRTADRIVTGSVPHAEVVSWIHAADIGALPSYYEGCSVALLEMLAGGLFVLTHDVGNAEQVIRDGVNGRIVSPRNEAWRAALGDALERLPRGGGLDRAFGWDRIAEQTEEIYREIVAGIAPVLHAS